MVGRMDEVDGVLPGENGLIVNPFDADTTDTLHLPHFSPSVFARTVTPSKEISSPSEFTWSIDNLAILHPVDIDETVHQDSGDLDVDVEEKAQKAIDKFFSQKELVPSPWTESRQIKHVKFSPNPPSTDDITEHCSDTSMQSPKGANINKNNIKGVDACCQTTLTIPSDLDLQAVLGHLYSYNEDGDYDDEVSLSSLRRKLFFQGKNSSLLSPVKNVGSSQQSTRCGENSPSISPVSSSYSSHDTPVKTSPLNQFSSSPIQRNLSSCLRTPHVLTRASSSCSVAMDTPSLSPVIKSILKTPGTCNSGTGCSFISLPEVSPITSGKHVARIHQSESRINVDTPVKSLSFMLERTLDNSSCDAPCHENTRSESHDRGSPYLIGSECMTSSLVNSHSPQLIGEDSHNHDSGKTISLPTMTTPSVICDSEDVNHAECLEHVIDLNPLINSTALQDTFGSEVSTHHEVTFQVDSGFTTQSMDIEITNSESHDYFSVSCDKALNNSQARIINGSSDSDFSTDCSSDFDMSVVQTDLQNEKKRISLMDKSRQRIQSAATQDGMDLNCSNEPESNVMTKHDVPKQATCRETDHLIKPKVKLQRMVFQEYMDMNNTSLLDLDTPCFVTDKGTQKNNSAKLSAEESGCKVRSLAQRLVSQDIMDCNYNSAGFVKNTKSVESNNSLNSVQNVTENCQNVTPSHYKNELQNEKLYQKTAQILRKPVVLADKSNTCENARTNIFQYSYRFSPCSTKYRPFYKRSRTKILSSPRIINQNKLGAPFFPWKPRMSTSSNMAVGVGHIGTLSTRITDDIVGELTHRSAVQFSASYQTQNKMDE